MFIVKHIAACTIILICSGCWSAQYKKNAKALKLAQEKKQVVRVREFIREGNITDCNEEHFNYSFYFMGKKNTLQYYSGIGEVVSNRQVYKNFNKAICEKLEDEGDVTLKSKAKIYAVCQIIGDEIFYSTPEEKCRRMMRHNLKDFWTVEFTGKSWAETP